MPWDGYSMMNWFPFFGFWVMAFWLIILIVAAYLIYRLILAGLKFLRLVHPANSRGDPG